MVPIEVRSAVKYNGFSLSIDTMALLEKYNLVDTHYQPMGEHRDEGERG